MKNATEKASERALVPSRQASTISSLHKSLLLYKRGAASKKQSGLKVERVGFFERDALVRAMQVTFHPVPLLGSVGYAAEVFAPDGEQLDALRQAAQKHGAIFTKI